MGCIKCLAIFTVFVALASMYYYVPVPDEFSKPMPVRITMGILEIVQDLSYLASKVANVEPILVRAKLFAAMSKEADRSSEATVKISERTLDGVPVHIYSPVNAAKNGPGIVYTHGGGWMYGTMEMYDTLIYSIAEETNMKVIAVDWRGTFVKPFPGTFDDCATAASYVLKHAKEFDIDPKRIAIMGDSAGGNLAATITLSFRKAENKPKLQVLIYPVLQALEFETPSYQEKINSRLMLTTYDMMRYLEYYATGQANSTNSLTAHRHVAPAVRKQLQDKYMPLGGLPKKYVPEGYQRPAISETTDKYALQFMAPLLGEKFSPLFAKDLTGLPDTFIYTAQYDVVRDEAIWYTNRLQKANVKVEQFIHEASYHGIMSMYQLVPEGREALDRIVKYTKDNL